MTREVSVGIIGYGFMGRTHTFGYVNLPLYYEPAPVRVKKLVLCTTSEKNIQAARETGYYETIVRDWRQLIEDRSIEIIHICTPNFLHYDMLQAAIQAGKYIYCDKPITATYDEARKIETLIETTRYTKTNQMCFNLRFFPATLRAKQLMEQKFTGQVLNFRAHFLHSSNVDPARPVNWKSDKIKGGGGVIVDLGSHVFDILTHLLGPVRALRAETRIFTPLRPDGQGGQVKMDGEEMALITLEMENGALGTIEVSKVATGSNDELRFEIHGRDGAMRYNQMKANWLSVYDNRDSDTPLGGTRGWKAVDCLRRYEAPGDKFPGPKVSIGWLRPHVHCLYNFLAALAADRPADPDLKRGIEIQKLLHLAYRSAEEKQWVTTI
jgi:predicted dehydrogenase